MSHANWKWTQQEWFGLPFSQVARSSDARVIVQDGIRYAGQSRRLSSPGDRAPKECAQLGSRPTLCGNCRIYTASVSEVAPLPVSHYYVLSYVRRTYVGAFRVARGDSFVSLTGLLHAMHPTALGTIRAIARARARARVLCVSTRAYTVAYALHRCAYYVCALLAHRLTP